MSNPNAHTGLAQAGGTPRRHYYSGSNPDRAITIADLRARTHRRMPRLALEYLEGGAEDEATLSRERTAFAQWRFLPRSLRDVSERTVAAMLLGKQVPLPAIIAPTGLNGIFMRGADLKLARAAAGTGIPFVQSTMSNELIEDVARTPRLRHWFQLYVFGEESVWRSLVERADRAGCEALVLTTNSQIYGNREWDARTRATRTRPTVSAVIDAALHPAWLASTLWPHGLPQFANLRDYVPPDRRGFFSSAFWVRDQMWTNLDWRAVAQIRDRWRRPLFIKGLLHPDDLRKAREVGADGVVLSCHGGRQLDWSAVGLDVLPCAREIVGPDMTIIVSGGARRGTDILKAVALGADAIMLGRAPLYGLCAYGEPGVRRCFAILQQEASDALGLLGARTLEDLDAAALMREAELQSAGFLRNMGSDQLLVSKGSGAQDRTPCPQPPPMPSSKH
jgi:(S)-mandelate dehydrogenase